MNRSMLFIYLNVVNDCFEGADFEIYTSYLRSYLKLQGIDTRQYINRALNSKEQLIEDLLQNDEKIYVFYVNEYNYYINKIIVNAVKNDRKENMLVCIGPMTQYVYSYKNEMYFDFYSIHEYDSLPKCAREEFISSSLAHDFQTVASSIEISQIPHPYSNGIVPVREVINVGLLTSRGCYGRCNFCSYTDNDRIQEYPIESIIYELDYIRDHLGNIDAIIYFRDDCFSITRERIVRLCTRMIEKNYKFRFWCCLRYDLITIDMLSIMKQARIQEPVIGLESASKELLQHLGKLLPGHSPDYYLSKIMEINLWAEHLSYPVVFSVNFGLHQERFEDALETIDFLIRNNIMNISVNYMTLFPGSRICRESKAQVEKLVLEGPTRFPYRTYYENYNMLEIARILSKINHGNINQFVYNVNIHRTKFLQYYTGIHSCNSDFFTYQVKYIKVNELNSKVLQFIDRFLCTDGVIFTLEDESDKKKVYSDNRKMLKMNLTQYDTNLAISYQSDTYIENQYRTTYKEDKIYVNVNNYAYPIQFRLTYIHELKHRIEFIQMNYSKFLNDQYYTLQRVNCELVNDICQIVNCCSLNQITRVAIKDQDVLLCGKKVVGNLDDLENMNFFQKLKQINSSHKHQTVRCPLLNEEEKELLSDFWRECPNIRLYLNIIAFLYKYSNYLKVEKGFYIYCNWNITNEMIKKLIPNDIGIILGSYICIVYNASSHKAHFCDLCEKEMISESICDEWKEKEDNYFLKLERIIRLVRE